MDIARILTQLKIQRDRLNTAIAALEDISPSAEKSSRPTKRSARRPTKSRPKARTPSSDNEQPMGKLIAFRRTRRRPASKPFKAEA